MFRRAVWLLALLSLVCLGVACTPNRADEANRVRDAVVSMPGVTSAKMSYSNDFTNGPNFGLTLEMSEASIQQITAVAARIRDAMGADFDSHRQGLGFEVTQDGFVERNSYGYSGQTADLDPARIGADALLVRDLVPLAGGTTLSRDTNIGPRLTTRYIDNPDAVAPLALPLLAGQDLTMRINSKDTRVHGDWGFRLPLTVERWRELARLRNAMPANVYSTYVEEGAIRKASVGLRTPGTAARDLTDVIDAVNSTQEHKLTIQWRVLGGPPNSKESYGEPTVCGRSGTAVTLPSASDTTSLSDYLAAAYTLCRP